MSAFDTLYQSGPNGLWIFLLCSVVLGGGAAFVAGKAIAETWRPRWQVVVYGLLLALVVRFVHFALFEEVLLSWRNFLVDASVTLVMAFVGYSVARGHQMAVQYGFDRSVR